VEGYTGKEVLTKNNLAHATLRHASPSPGANLLFALNVLTVRFEIRAPAFLRDIL
jgi:hypothetical protein